MIEWRSHNRPSLRLLLLVVFFLSAVLRLDAQNDSDPTRTVTGVVLDENDEPLPSASVMVKGTSKGMITDMDGRFSLQVKTSDKTLVVSFVGMTSQEVSIIGKQQVTVKLMPDAELLSEVIVTGYQTISKERATGSFAVLSSKDMKGKLQSNITSRLEGQIAGLVQQGNEMHIRGLSTLKGVSQPLFVVDGMPFEGNIASINPSMIENVTVLKDAAAASIYGARAANGVIVITTRSGSRDNKTRVSYDGSIRFRPKPDLDYLNLMSSSELVDLQEFGFKYVSGTYENLNNRYALNPVEELLYKHRSSLITDAELKAGLDVYRNLDNRAQFEDFYLRTGVMHQHNVSVAGGNDKHRYVASVDYVGDRDNARYSSDERLGFNFRNTMKFFDWLTADLAATGSFTKSDADTGMGDYYEFYTSYPSYYMLRDTDGNPLNILLSKSESELANLISIGLKDESYSPIRNRAEETSSTRGSYYRVQAGLDFKLMEGLNLNLKYQTEKTFSKSRALYSRFSYKVANMINDAAQYDSSTTPATLTLNVPEGGQLSELRSDNYSYTFRAQLNFLKNIGKHYITALGGAERRLIRTTSTMGYYMGYDDTSLGFKPYDSTALKYLTGTTSLGGSFTWDYSEYNRFRAPEDRYVSFYVNASYTYDYKYNLTGSIRTDQSNLFGTDPKYQYRPLWSLGANWYMAEEAFMDRLSWIDQLNVRLTYGIGGNVPKNASPYLTLYAAVVSPWVSGFASQIKNAPNSALRWEKTATTNFGVDFAFFKRKLTGSIDYYYKYTTDLLANRPADPTLGFSQLMLNYGRMSNKGVEVTLNGNLAWGDWRWSPGLTFSYNKNKLIDVKDSNVTAFNYTNGNAAVAGYPAGAVFSYRYAGLRSTDGRALFYNSAGEAVTSITSIDDLVYSGTNTPPYAASLSNRLAYKNFELSFMCVFYGGHVFRGQATPILTAAPGYNADRELLNVWRAQGDEKKENVVPAFTGTSVSMENRWHPWAAADKHVFKGDYIKLRDVSLSYSFDKSLLSKFKMESLTLTLQVQNLWKWTANDKGYDPEAMTTYQYGWGLRTVPTPVTYTLGASINF